MKVLGLNWDPLADSFKIHVEAFPTDRPTKRKILSVIAKLYDPLEWLSPVVIMAKQMMQQIWLRKLEWDDTLPDDLLIQSKTYYTGLRKLE